MEVVNEHKKHEEADSAAMEATSVVEVVETEANHLKMTVEKVEASKAKAEPELSLKKKRC